MADTKTPRKTTFDPAKGYNRLRFIYDRDVMEFELNELQAIRAWLLKQLSDRLFKDGAILAEVGGTVGDAVQGVYTGDDTATAGGTYAGLETQTYTVIVSQGGAPGTAKFRYETNGSDKSEAETTIEAFDTEYAVGSLGVTIKFTDGGDGVLTVADSWLITATYEESPPVRDGNTLTIADLLVYVNGEVWPVQGKELTYEEASSGHDYVYLEWLRKIVTYDEDSELTDPEAGEPISQREKIALDLKASDTSGDALPGGAVERRVYAIYDWDRATNVVERVIERHSRLHLNRLDGILDADRMQHWDVAEDLKGHLAERTFDESGSYLVEGGDSYLDPTLNDGDDIAVKTKKLKAYVAGLQIKTDLDKLLMVPKATATAEVQNEGHGFNFGTNHYPLNKSIGGDDFPVKEISELSAQVRVSQGNTRGGIPGGQDELPLTPVAQILAVTQGTVATLTGSGATYTFDPDTNEFKVTASEYDGSAGTVQSIKFKTGTWTVAQVLEALNYGRGPAYLSGSASRNLIYEEATGEIKVSTLSRSASSTVTIGDGSANADIGCTGSSSDTGTGTHYQATTDYIQSGNYVDWSPGGAEPSGGSTYYVVWGYTKSMVEDTDFKFQGDLSAGTRYYKVTAINAVGESLPAAAVNVNVEDDDIVRLSWATVSGATGYRIYQGLSESACYLLTELAATTSFQNDGYWSNDGSTLAPTSATNSLNMTDVEAEIMVVGVVNFNVSGGEIPMDGEIFYADYEYYQPRIDVRYLNQAGEVKDVRGRPADDPNAPRCPEKCLPLAEITCPPNSEDLEIENYRLRRVTMIELQELIQQVEDLRYNDARQNLYNQIMDRDDIVKKGVFVDAFVSEDYADVTHEDYDCTIDIEKGEITLPFNSQIEDLSRKGTSTTVQSKTYDILPYSEVLEINQDQYSQEMQVNPYDNYDPLPSRIGLTPRKDHWVRTETIPKYLHRIIHFNTYDMRIKGAGNPALERYVRTNPVARRLGLHTLEIKRLIESREDLYMRQIEVQVDGHLFVPNEDNITLYFDDRKVDLTPIGGTLPGTDPGTVKADATASGGRFSATFTIPSGVRVGTRTVKVTGGSGSEADTTFTASGKVDVFERYVFRVRTYWCPLAQSFGFDDACMITKIDLPMAQKGDATDPLDIDIKAMLAGMPAETIGVVRHLDPSEINVGPSSHNYIQLDDPFLIEAGVNVALALNSDSNAYKAYVGVLGQGGLNPVEWITKNLYGRGVLFSSSNNESWTIHNDADLRFKIYRAEFQSSAWIYFDQISWADVTDLVLVTDQAALDGTAIEWEYSVDGGVSWIPFEPYAPVAFNATASTVDLRCKLTTSNSKLSPFVNRHNWMVDLRSNKATGTYITKTSEMAQDINACRVYIQLHTPTQCTQTPYVSDDGGLTYSTMTLDETREIDSEFVEYVYSKSFAGDNNKFKFKLVQATTSKVARPRARMLGITIT